MTVRNPPVFQQAGSFNAENVRQMIAAQAASGVVRSADLVVSPGGGMSVNVSAGSAFISGTEATFQGSYYFINDAPVNLIVAASAPTNARNDLVIARIRDAGYSGAFSDAALVVVTGVASGVPVDPVVPADSIVLARLVIPALAASVIAGYITDLRPLSIETWPAQGVSGLIGATAGTRAVGATNGGPPTTGTFLQGDTVVDRTLGVEWICTAAGTPGTWKVDSDPAMFGIGGSVLGGTPPLLTAGRFLVQAGSTVATTVGTIMTVPFPVPFPNGVLIIIPSPGDPTSLFSIAGLQVGATVSQFAVNCMTNTGVGINNTALRLNWLAVGW